MDEFYKNFASEWIFQRFPPANNSLHGHIKPDLSRNFLWLKALDVQIELWFIYLKALFM